MIFRIRYVTRNNPLHVRGLGLCPFSALVCDMLPRRFKCYMVRQRRITEDYLKDSFDEHSFKLEDTRLTWCLSDPGGGWQRGFSPELPRATWSRPNPRRISHFFPFSNSSCGGCKSAISPTCDGSRVASRRVASRVKCRLRPPQVEKKGEKIDEK